MSAVVISGTGLYQPPHTITNAELVESFNRYVELQNERNAADIAASPYAIAVSMVLDQMDDKRIALHLALKKNRVTIARDVLADIDQTEAALRLGIRELDASEWGTRLAKIRDGIAILVEAEVSRFPDQLGHILKSRNGGQGLLTGLLWKGRDAISDGAMFCKRLIGQT